MLQATAEMFAASHYVLLGLVELGNRNYKNTAAQFDRALQEYPESPAALLGRTLASTMQIHEVPLDQLKSILRQIISDLEHLLDNSKRMLENIEAIPDHQ